VIFLATIEKPKAKDRLAQEFLDYFLFGKPPWVVRIDYPLEDEKALAKGSIVDIETTGLFSTTDMIITLGILRKRKASVYQLTSNEYLKFWKLCVNLVLRAPIPRYAYAAHFEAEWLNIKDGWQDLTQYAERRDDFYGLDDFDPYYRLRLDACTFSPFQEHDITSQQVPIQWRAWLKERNPKILYEVAFHNLCDLLRVRQLIGR